MKTIFKSLTQTINDDPIPNVCPKFSFKVNPKKLNDGEKPTRLDFVSSNAMNQTKDIKQILIEPIR